MLDDEEFFDAVVASPAAGPPKVPFYAVDRSTDDSTVFDTSSSRELALAALACNLSAEDVVRLALRPLEHAFDVDGASRSEPDAAAGLARGTSPLRGRFEASAAAVLARYLAGAFDDP